MMNACTERRHNEPTHRRGWRPGVSGVLAMMFLVIFSSLAVAMAIVSQGNLRTADTHLRVIRAQGAVDTGLEIAEARLAEAAARFVVSKGQIDTNYAAQLWNGTYGASPTVTVLLAPDGRAEPALPVGIAQAIRYAHDADDNDNLSDEIVLPAAPAGWVRAAPIGLERDPSGRIVTAAQIDYAPPDAQGRVLVIATGYEWDWSRNRWITRSAQQSFGITKTLGHAIIAPSRVMIGRNVQVEGPLGVLYDSAALDTIDGPPLVALSDFYGLHATLDAKLDAFYARVLNDDVDGDNRLRPGHATEGAGFGALNGQDFDGDGTPDAAYEDVTGDGSVDDFDIFLKHYDANGDGMVVLSAALTDGTPSDGLGAEFTADDALAELIDSGLPDRNANGRYNGALAAGAWVYATFPDNNLDGVRDAADVDADDVALGYRDGALDFRDRYAKIRGSVYFKATRNQWQTSKDEFGVAVGDYQKNVQGSIRADAGEQPVSFEASDDELPLITEDSFAEAAELMGEFSEQPGVTSQPFWTQVDAAMGNGWTPATRIESTPFGAPSPGDWYARPVFEGITFRNVVIPMGLNALFIDCTFVGVTRVEAYTNNTHPSWVFYGEQAYNAATGALTLVYPPPPAESDAQLDKSYSAPGAPNYDTLPDPLVVPIDLNGDGTASDQVTDTKRLANNLRFHDCLFVGSIVADKPAVFQNIRNKLSFTGATRFTEEHPSAPLDPEFALSAEEKEITAKSSMMAPHYSVDIGTNNSPQSQDVSLQGAVIAGVLDVRGNASIKGALLLTYEPEYGTAPMALYGAPVGNPGGFNVTLGYFGPDDGDQEGIDLSALTDLDGDGTKDVGWDAARDANGALIPVGTAPEQDWWFDGQPDDLAQPGVHLRRAIPFNGFGKIKLELDPDLVLPDGLASPISVKAVRSTYAEGRYHYPVAGGVEPDAN